MPSILDLCKRVAMNKNKLQKAFQLTEGKSIGEYVRTLRMEQALELLEQSNMTVQEIAAAIGYHGVSNFYHAFQQKFGSTPQAVRDMLKKIGAALCPLQNKFCYQELLCRGWFLPPNTYDCGSFVVNGTAVVEKEKKSPYNHWKSTQKGADLYEINI